MMVLCTCELNRNWSLFLTTNENVENISWEWTGRMFISVSGY
jgi:hypothetical protein